MIDFTKDRIFTNFLQPSYYHMLFKTCAENPKIQIKWADGFFHKNFPDLKSNKNILLTNNIILQADEYTDNIHTVNESYYGIMYYPYNTTCTDITLRDFNFFSHRYTGFRQSWFYHLIRRNWLDRGFVSFNCVYQDNTPMPASWRDASPIEIFEEGFQKYNNPVFINEHKVIKDQIPFKNFNDTGDLYDLIINSKFSIVAETWYHDNRVITFSEKTLRCLQLPRPWLLCTVQNGVHQLRNWGFDVLDDIVDHHYDTLESAIERQMAMLDQAEKLMHLNIKKISERCAAAATHNQQILKTWNNQWFINMKKDLEIAQQKVLALNDDFQKDKKPPQ